MPSYTVDVPGLGSYTVDSPSELTEYQAYLAVKRQIDADKARMEPAAGVGEAFMGGLKRFGSSAGTALSAPFMGATEAAEAGLKRQEGITERPGASLEKVQSVYEQEGLWPAIKEGVSQIPTAIAEQAPNLAAMAGSARLGGMAGAPLGPWGVAGGALLGAAGASFLPQAGSNIERQAKEDIAAGRPVDVSGAKAGLTAIPQAALDVVAGKIAFGRILGLSPAQLGTEAAEQVAKQSLTRAMAVGAAKSPFAEVPTEVMQQVLERAQAGLPLTTEDAMDEYKAIAYQTALLAPLGAVEGVSNRSAAQQQVEQAEAEKQAGIAATQQRQQAFTDTYLQKQAAEEQQQADILGEQAVRDEIAKYDAETQQRIVDTLSSLRTAKNQAEIDAILKDEDETRQILEMYAEDQRKASTFGEHSLDEMGIPKSKKIVDLLSPMFGKPIDEIRGAIDNRLEEIKKVNKGENDDQINAAIDDYLNTKLGSAEQRTQPSPPSIDPQYESVVAPFLAERVGTTTNMPVGYAPEGYSFTEGMQQRDLFMPGESVSNPLFNEALRGEKVAPAEELTLNDILRGGAYDPNFEGRQLDLGIEQADGGAGVESDLRPRGELARNQALELQRLGGVGGPAAAPAGATGQFTGTLDERGQAWANNLARINKIRNNKKLTTPEQQAKAVNQIAKILGTMGFSTRSTPTAFDEKGNPTAMSNPAMDKALQITKGVWEAQPMKPEPKGRKYTPSVEAVDPETITRGFDPVWRTIAEGEKIAKNEESRNLLQETAGIANKLEDALVAGDKTTALNILSDLNTRLESAQLKKNPNAPARKAMQKLYDSVQNLAGEDIQASKKGKGKGKKGYKRVVERTEQSTTPTTVEALEEVGNELFPRKNFVVVQSYDELPDGLREEAIEREAKAFYDPKSSKVYMIADQIMQGDEKGTILHETGVHRGLPKLIGQGRINALANRVLEWGVEGEKTLEGRIAQEAIDLADASGEQIGSDRHNQEVVAYFTEIAVNRYGIDPLKTQPKEYRKIAGWLRELWNGVLAAVKKLHMNPNDLTAQDIVQLVYGAARIESQTAVEGDVQASRAVAAQPTPAEIAAAQAAGRQFYYTKQEPTFAEKVKNTVGNDFLGWLAVKMVGGGEALALKGNKMFGPQARLNPATGKELGYLNYHRALHDTDLATGAAEFGFLDMDKEGVIHVRDSKENIVALNGLANNIKAAMRANGMSETEANDAFAHMMLADRFKALQDMGELSPTEFSPQDYAYGKQLQKQYAAEYKAWQDMYQTIRGRTMDILVKSGTFTKKKAQEFLDRLEYIPFNREHEGKMADGVFLRSLLSAKAEFHLQGSSRPVNDVMGNIVDNQVWLMKRAIRNNASNLIADTMEEMHRRNPLMGGYAIPMDDGQGNNISYLKNGKPQWFKVLDSNDAAIFSAAPVVSNMALRIMRMFTGYLRKGVTLMPSFHYSQIIQDAMRAPVIAGTEAGMSGLLKTSAPQFIENAMSRETKLAKELRRAGIIGQIDYQDTYDNWKKELLGNQRQGVSRILEKAEAVAQANDLATRSAVYDDVLKSTGDANEATLRALMMINFQNRGHSSMMNFLMSAAPFVNSRIQGEYRLLMALSGNIPGVTPAHARQLVMWRMAKLAAFTALYTMAASGDDDYERANEEVRNNNFLMNGVRIPVAPEFLPVKVAIEKGYRLLTDQEFETGAKAARAELAAVAGLFIGAGDVTPTLLKPLIENTTNYSFFTGRHLVGYHQQSMDVNQQFNDGTSEMSKAISDALQEVGGNTVNLAPVKIDNLIRGWFGSMGRDVLLATDMMSGKKPEQKFNQLPIIGAMSYDMEGGALKSDFYEIKDKSDRAVATFNDLKKKDQAKAREYLEENRELIAINSRVSQISNMLNEVRAQKQRWTAQDPETAREKINELETRVHERLKDLLPPIMQKLNEE